MTISETREKCKSLVARMPRDVLIISILMLATSLSFGLGYLAGKDAGQTIDISLQSSPTTTIVAGQVVASKSGTKYYLPTCAGVSRISDANKIWFPSASIAETAGYTPATNCAGL
jgi:hypothetical protein